ncbi:cytochrome P450 [Armillaria solidipes]|uniref:Cytochrome P450 n=1 Tax=Armillaria solidipes TaxID=1076256 RepID=A0A2H3C473_9AGAR|nr:cytochrome P450 [Armillaria solidipes]
MTMPSITSVCIALIARKTRARALNEPPISSYWIPLVGHALSYRKWTKELFHSTRTLSGSDARPVSLVLFGQRVYVVTASRDISAVFCSKNLLVGPVVLHGVGTLFNVSKESLDRIARIPDGRNSSLIDDIHPFYFDVLKEGPALNEVITSFLHCLGAELAKEDAKIHASSRGVEVQLQDWMRTILGNSSTVFMMGSHILEEEPNLLAHFHQFTLDLLTFGMGLPRCLSRKKYENRDRLIGAFIRVYQDREIKQQDAIWWVTALQKKLVEAGVTCDYDIGASMCSSWFGLQANVNPASFWLLLQAVTIPGLADRIRKSIAPAFNSRGEVVHLEFLVGDPLLRSTFYETLRLFALSIPLRLVMEDTIISGFTFRKGGIVMCPVRPVHGDTDIWGPDAAEFVPERFIREPVGGLLRGDTKNL